MKKVIIMDSSALSSFMDCNTMWNYEYQERLTLATLPKGGMARDKGTCIHELLDKYYHFLALNPDKSPYIAMQYSVDLFKAKETAFKLGFDKDFQAFLIQRFSEYVTFYLGRDFKVLKTNLMTGTELGFSKVLYEDDNFVFILEGRIDLLIENDLGNGVSDHKSQEKFSNLYGNKIQFLTYAWAADVKYVIVNYFGLTKTFDGDKTFRRQLIQVNDYLLERWKTKVLEAFWKIALKPNNEKWTDLKYQNINSCSGAFESHPCMFCQLCESRSDEGRETLKRTQYIKGEKWKPW